MIERFLGLKLLVFDIDANFIKLLLALIFLFLLVFFIDYKKYKIRKIIFIVLAIIFALYISLMYLFCFCHSYFSYYSPYENSKRELVVEETTFLGSGKSCFYERKYIIFIKKIHGEISYDVAPIFSSERATIKWLDENSVQVDYINNSMGHRNTEIVKFN